MSRIKTKDRAEILSHQLSGVLSRREIAKKYGVTESFIADLDAQLEMLISRGLLSPEDGISFDDFTKAMQPIVDLAEDLIRAGMSNEQVHKICKLSFNHLKHTKKALLDKNFVRRPSLLFSQGLDGQVYTSIFAINYKHFSTASTNLVSVLIALLISQKQAKILFPREKYELSLKEAYEIAEDIDAEKKEMGHPLRYVMDCCPNCGLPFIHLIRGAKKRARCPFCALDQQRRSEAEQALEEQKKAELTEKSLAENALAEVKKEEPHRED